MVCGQTGIHMRVGRERGRVSGVGGRVDPAKAWKNIPEIGNGCEVYL